MSGAADGAQHGTVALAFEIAFVVARAAPGADKAESDVAFDGHLEEAGRAGGDKLAVLLVRAAQPGTMDSITRGEIAGAVAKVVSTGPGWIKRRVEVVEVYDAGHGVVTDGAAS